MTGDSACERVGQLRGVSWRWRPDAPDGLSGDDMGVLAQDVDAVLPELVRRGDDGYLEVDYGGLVTELVAAISELHDRARSTEAGADTGSPACASVARLSPGGPGDVAEPLDPAVVAEVFPAAVRRDGARPRVAPHTLVAPLIEAVKELDARLRALERRSLR